MYFPPFHGRNYHQSMNNGMYPPQFYQQSNYWQQPNQPPMQQNQGQQQSQQQNTQQPPQSQSQQQQMQHAPFFHGGPGGYSYPPHGMQKTSFMSAFKTKDGKFDFEKASTTIDQVMKIGNQVSPIVKQVGGFFTTKN
ncbi:YppG family protein [Evansella sp. AB-P1]|uniref:YppG family protein n=1 Tax=Evansella sp. AB-P1 TaxID=3037653 RepID=UPI00241CDA35|nr:YppG family protein [Evansella sp. AB-P1]MDG5789512.1 YppG family protein [Evansella sp. AB-P1]